VYTIIVTGRPASHNATAQVKAQWRVQVQTAAAQVFANPLQDHDIRVNVTFYFDGEAGPVIDADNASKPVLDALQTIAYANDNQVTARHAHRRNIAGTFRVKGADPAIIDAIRQGNEFVCIKIDNEGENIHDV
jgi:Holliday junction resolvase RusA-like endonuclease